MRARTAFTFPCTSGAGSAALIGVGASLVLDEFAMIFHLQDVYWTQEGQLSVNVVTLATAFVGLGVAGISPFGVNSLDDTAVLVRGSVAGALVLHLVLVAVTAFKGKYLTALFGLPIAPVAWIAAFRLARPHSLWARKLYSAKRIEHATKRAAEFDERWGPVRSTWDDFIGGRPSQPDPSDSSH